MFHESQLLLYLAAYLIGTIPFGLLLTKAAGMGDIRQVGSGNIGATNVLRAGGKKVALLTLLLDAGKGYVAVWGLYYIVDSAYMYMCTLHEDVSNCTFAPIYVIYWFYLTGLIAIIGHCFPIWLKFKGGKGVATAFGVIFALSWQVGLCCAITWLVMFRFTRYSSLSAIITMLLMPAYAYFILFIPALKAPFFRGDANQITLTSLTILAAISLLIILRHHSNIRNLLAGTEHKFGKKDEP